MSERITGKSPDLEAVLAALEGHAGTLTFTEGHAVRRLIAELRTLSTRGSISEQVHDRILAAFVDEWADKPGFAQLAALLLKTVLNSHPAQTFPRPVVVAVVRP